MLAAGLVTPSNSAAITPPATGPVFELAQASRDARLKIVIRAADADPAVLFPIIPLMLKEKMQMLGTVLGMFSLSTAEHLWLRGTNKINSSVGQRDMTEASEALERTGYRGFDVRWSKDQKSAFILGAAQVGRYLQAGEITRDEALFHLQELTKHVARLPPKPQW